MTDTTAIDDRRNVAEKKVENIASSSFNFIKKTSKSVFYLMVYFACGSILLYCSKIGKANVLPEVNDCIPKIPDNIFNVFSTKVNSQKIKFNDNPANTKNLFLDIFRTYTNKKEGKDTFVLYFISLFESIILNNNIFFNLVFSSFNDYFSESVIVFFGPIILSILIPLLGCFDCIYFMYLWIVGITIFFTKEDYTTGKMKGFDKDNKLSSYVFALIKAVLCLCTISVALGLAPVVVPVLILMSLFGMIGYKGKFQTGENVFNKDLSAGSFIIESFKFYKVQIMAIISLIITVNAFVILGGIAGLFALIVILLIKFDYLKIDIFNPNVPDFESPKIDDCNPNVIPEVKDTPPCNNLPGNACNNKKQSGGSSMKKGQFENFVDNITGKSQKDLNKLLKRLNQSIHL